MNNNWHNQLMRCAEGMYVLEEESKQIVWANAYIQDGIQTPCIGETCWKSFLGREEPCPFCPQLSEKDGVYVWDYYDSRSKRWMKIKQVVFQEDGRRYRAGNLNMIDDVMHLNYDTVQEILLLGEVLEKNRDELNAVRRVAAYDTLTGLKNRYCFQRDLVQEYTEVCGLGVLYFDLNNLKQTNDQFRHETGDLLLCRLADALKQTARMQVHAECYRIGGDEFVMIIPDSTEEELIRGEAFFYRQMDTYNKQQQWKCSVAVGRAFTEKPCNPKELVAQADQDMYKNKQRMKGLLQ